MRHVFSFLDAEALPASRRPYIRVKRLTGSGSGALRANGFSEG